VRVSADLAITITAPAPVTKGATVTYTVVVTNNGPAAARNGALFFVTGPDVSLVSATPAPLIRASGVWTWASRSSTPDAR
jgi:hypothetical protein